MLVISSNVTIAEHELEITPIRAQGPGGQNVNKVSSAIHLRFDIWSSSLPDFYKQRLSKLSDSRISKEGIIVIKAQQYRTQEKNKDDALQRLHDIIKKATFTPKARRPTKPSKNAVKKRVDKKVHRGKIKSMRGKVTDR